MEYQARRKLSYYSNANQIYLDFEKNNKAFQLYTHRQWCTFEIWPIKNIILCDTILRYFVNKKKSIEAFWLG